MYLSTLGEIANHIENRALDHKGPGPRPEVRDRCCLLLTAQHGQYYTGGIGLDALTPLGVVGFCPDDRTQVIALVLGSSNRPDAEGKELRFHAGTKVLR